MHIHYMPPSLAQDREFFQREPYWEFLAEPGSTKSVQGWATAERMLADMDLAGIDRVVLQGEYFAKHESAVRRNDQVLDIVKRWPDRVMAFAAIQPKAGTRALDELQRCLDRGMRGVGEIAPYAQGYTLDDPDFLRLAEACIAHDVPLLLHANEEVGHYYRGKATTPLARYYRLAVRYPELKLILAHWGGGLIFYELMPEVAKTLRNVRYDTAASPLLYPTEKIFRVALQCLDPRKILYASDYPLLVYPRKQREPDFCLFLEEIDALELAPDICARVMGGNAAQLLGLTPADKPDDMVRAARPLGTQGDSPLADRIDDTMAVSLVAQLWPQTRAVFDRYGLPWRDDLVPFWEPIVQSACARGLDAPGRQRLLDELNEAVGK